jgi:hypothetical protein
MKISAIFEEIANFVNGPITQAEGPEAAKNEGL